VKKSRRLCEEIEIESTSASIASSSRSMEAAIMTWHRLCSPAASDQRRERGAGTGRFQHVDEIGGGSAARRVCVGTQEDTSGMNFGLGYRC
jgi:hypothetical protein